MPAGCRLARRSGRRPERGSGIEAPLSEGQIHVVIHELTKGVGERRQRSLVDRGDVLRRIGGIGLVVDDVGNRARAGILGQRRRIVRRWCSGRGKRKQIGAGDAPVRIGDIVADFVDRTIHGRGRVIGGQDDSVVEFLQRRTRATVPSGDGRSRFMQPGGLPQPRQNRLHGFCSLAGECPGVRGDPWFVMHEAARELSYSEGLDAKKQRAADPL